MSGQRDSYRPSGGGGCWQGPGRKQGTVQDVGSSDPGGSSGVREGPDPEG